METFNEFVDDKLEYKIIDIDYDNLSITYEYSEKPLNEAMEIRDLRSIRPITKTRSRKITTKLVDLKPAGVLVFKSTSGTDLDAGFVYTQYVKLMEWEDYFGDLSNKDATNIERARLVLLGEVQVYCSCKAFRYWGSDYITTQFGARFDHDSTNPDPSAPDIRDLPRENTICKHLERVLSNYMKYAPMIAGIIKRKGIPELGDDVRKARDNDSNDDVTGVDGVDGVETTN